MKNIELSVPIKPKGKQRPVVTRRGTFTPKATVEFENAIKNAFKTKYPNFEPIDGDAKAKITALFEVPKSYSKKKRAELLPIMGVEHSGASYTSRPDCDNIAKAVLDSLNGLAYKDDSQISCLLVIKEYGFAPELQIQIEEIK